ncbi:hypothetical protein M1534_03105 [Patescibacteria group bacterium]|nr:hypothetical protein [Patescibacteria group bacterium]
MSRNQRMIVILLIVGFLVLAVIYGGNVLGTTQSVPASTPFVLFKNKVDSIKFNTGVFSNTYFMKITQENPQPLVINPGTARNPNPFVVSTAQTTYFSPQNGSASSNNAVNSSIVGNQSAAVPLATPAASGPSGASPHTSSAQLH